MPGPLLTSFKPDPARLKPLKKCIAGQYQKDSDFEWAGGILSSRTVVYGSGLIARRGDPVRHAVDPDELDLCKRLAAEARKVAKPLDDASGMDTEGEFHFDPFFVAATAGESSGGEIRPRLVRSRFGGTIFPPTTVAVERIRDRRAWWSEVSYEEHPYREDATEDCEREVAAWRALVGWFLGRAEFRDRAFVAVGDYVDTRYLKEEDGQFPPKVLTPSAFPRLVLGITKAGSLVGVCGHVVQT